MQRKPMRRLVAAVLVVSGALAGAARAQTGPEAIDLQGVRVNPFATPPGTATVLLFTSIDCPISNRYAPEVRRLFDAFASHGVRFWLVYPNPAEGAEAIGRHLADYGYPITALRDPDHELVKYAGATITPEAVVFDRRGQLSYRGRIDNRYVNLGLERPAATVHDLEAVLSSVVAGEPITVTNQPAVGCYIVDFVHIH